MGVLDTEEAAEDGVVNYCGDALDEEYVHYSETLFESTNASE